MEDSLQRLKLQIEALLFAAEHAVDVSEIRSHLGEVSLAEVRLALRDLANDYENRAFSLFEFGGKYQLRTREEHAELVSKQFGSKPRSLSKSALETLAIVAYQQPVTRAQVSSVRGVDSSAIVQSLKDRDLIYVSGTRKEVGTPLEYRTTTKFLEVFGLSKLEDLPNLRSLQMSVDDTKQVAKALASANGEEEVPPTAEELSFMDAEVVASPAVAEVADEIVEALEEAVALTPTAEIVESEITVAEVMDEQVIETKSSEILEVEDEPIAVSNEHVEVLRAGAEAGEVSLQGDDEFASYDPQDNSEDVSLDAMEDGTEESSETDEDEDSDDDFDDEDDDDEDDDDDFIEIDDDEDEEPMRAGAEVDNSTTEDEQSDDNKTDEETNV